MMANRTRSRNCLIRQSEHYMETIMPQSENSSNGTRPGLLSRLGSLRLPGQGGKRPNEGDKLAAKRKTSIGPLQRRILETLIQLCGTDQMLLGVIRKMAVPMLSELSQAQIEEGARFLHYELTAMHDAGLIDLGTIENRGAGQGAIGGGDGDRQDGIGAVSSRGPSETEQCGVRHEGT